MTRKKKDITPKDALVRLEDLCARAEHSSGEIAEKLRKWHIEPAESAKIIDELIRNKFIDDRRFAEAYVNDKIKFSRWGKRKVAQGLYQKGIARDIITTMLDAVDDDLYRENLTNAIQAKIKSNHELVKSYEGRTKIYRYLLSKGYEPPLAANILKEVLINLND